MKSSISVICWWFIHGFCLKFTFVLCVKMSFIYGRGLVGAWAVNCATLHQENFRWLEASFLCVTKSILWFCYKYCSLQKQERLEVFFKDLMLRAFIAQGYSSAMLQSTFDFVNPSLCGWYICAPFFSSLALFYEPQLLTYQWFSILYLISAYGYCNSVNIPRKGHVAHGVVYLMNFNESERTWL